MRAVSIRDLLERQGSSLRPTVADAAAKIRESFGRAYGRRMIPLDDVGEGDGSSEEVKGIRGMVRRAEKDARGINEEKGGWKSAPTGINTISY